MLHFRFPLPDEYRATTSHFGWRLLWNKWGFHTGEDHATPIGTPGRSFYPGYVLSIRKDLRAGLIIEIHHPSCGDVISAYYHLDDVLAEIGMEVDDEKTLYLTGNSGLWTTGPHCHIGVKVNGRWIDPSLTYD